MRMEQLYYFTITARIGSINQAAQQLHIAQQSLNHTLTSMENELGAKLLIRNRQGIQLTSEGEIFLTKAENILNEWTDALSSIRSFSKRDLQGNINLAIMELGNAFIYPQIFSHFLRYYPQVTLTPKISKRKNLIKRLLSDDCEIGLATVSTFEQIQPLNDEIENFPDELRFVPIADCFPHLWVSRSSPLAAKKAIYFQEAAQYPFVVQKDRDNKMLKHLFTQLQLSEPVFLYETANIRTIAQIVNDGLAVFIDSQLFAGDLYMEHIFSNTATVAIPIKDSYTVTIGYVVKKNHLDNPILNAMTAFLDTLYFKTST